MTPSPRKLAWSLLPLLLLFGGAELGLRLLGLDSTRAGDLAGTQGVDDGAWVQRRDRHAGPAFVPAEPQGTVRTAPVHRMRGMHDQSFPQDDEGERRLFALGGSTTVGVPFHRDERGFPERLERALAQAEPAIRWRIVNAGVPGMDSRGFPALAREAVALGADGLLVHAGDNELRGTLYDRCSGPTRAAVSRGLDRLATTRLLRSALRGWRAGGVDPFAPRSAAAPAQEALRAMLDAQEACMRRAVDESRAADRGAPGDTRTDPIYALTVQAFADNLDAVADIARDAGLPLWVVVPPVNLQDAPALGLPHASLPADPAREERVAGLVSRAGRGEAAAATELDSLLAGDPSDARLRHARGMLALGAGQPAQALPHLEAAVDLDWMGRRPTSALRQVPRELCARRPEVARCVDLDAAFRQASPGGIPGPPLFVDFCHPSRGPGVDLIVQAWLPDLRAWAPGG